MMTMTMMTMMMIMIIIIIIGQQRNGIPVSTPVHSSSKGECGLLPNTMNIT